MTLPTLNCKLLICLAFATSLGAADVRPQGEPIELFAGKSMDNFDTFVFGQGFNHDPHGVFQVVDGMIRVEGMPYGYFVTKDEFGDFVLHVEFKWGDATHGRRKNKARDSGILYRAIDLKRRAQDAKSNGTIWPQALEFQIMEGGTGDVILLGGAQLTVNGVRKGGKLGIQIDRFNKTDLGRIDGWPKHYREPAGFRDPNNEVEKPHGEWNLLEMVAEGDRVKYWVNGVLVMEGRGASLAKGKILFQSEGSELYFRGIKVWPLPALRR